MSKGSAGAPNSQPDCQHCDSQPNWIIAQVYKVEAAASLNLNHSSPLRWTCGESESGEQLQTNDFFAIMCKSIVTRIDSKHKWHIAWRWQMMSFILATRMRAQSSQKAPNWMRAFYTTACVLSINYGNINFLYCFHFAGDHCLLALKGKRSTKKYFAKHENGLNPQWAWDNNANAIKKTTKTTKNDP